MYYEENKVSYDNLLCNTRYSGGDGKGDNLNPEDGHGSCCRTKAGIAVPMASKKVFKKYVGNKKKVQNWWDLAKKCLAKELNDPKIREARTIQQLIFEVS